MKGNIVQLDGVTKRFRGLTAVSDVSFEIGEGERIGLIGPNGAGKTTLFALISGFTELTSGRILFKGSDVTFEKAYQLNRRGVARTFQLEQPLMDLSILDNVMVGAFYGKSPLKSRKSAQEKAAEIIDFVGLNEEIDKLARELGTPGRKRLELARALATSPDLLLLDEVMAGLTPSEVESAITLLRKISDTGITLIVVEHVMQAVMSLSDRVIVLHHGELIADGTPAEVTRDNRVIEVYLGED